MLPGPTLVHACPSCGGGICFGTLDSGNTFGIQVWTDGYYHAPMMPHQAHFVACPHCKVVSVSRAGKRLATVPAWENPAAAVPGAKPPAAARMTALVAVARREDTAPADALQARIEAWWAGNDRRRHMAIEQPAHTRPERANMEALAALLARRRKPEDRLMRAELLRELGRFDEALEVLAGKFPEPMQHAVKTIHMLAEAHDWQVGMLV
jgi:hypothetical protein